MAKYTIEEETLTGIANAIREKTGETSAISPLNMPAAIMSFRAGVELPPIEGTNQYLILDDAGNLAWENKVSVTPLVNTGTKLASINIGGEDVDLYYEASSVSLNGTATTSASFYAPTSAGTAGQVLKSNGSGAPSWITLGSNAYTSTAYLPLSGGTVAADLKAQGQFQSQSTSTHQYPGLWIRNDENADIGAVYMKPSSNNSLNIRWKRDDGGGDGFYYLSCKAADGSVTAPKFVGPLEGTATKATQDGNGKVISSTYLPLAGGTMTGSLVLGVNTGIYATYGDTNYDIFRSYNNGNFVINPCGKGLYLGYLNCNAIYFGVSGGWGSVTANGIYGAVWNDYAEFRNQLKDIKPGYIAYSEDDGKLRLTTERLQRFEGVVSDTFGFAIGETEDCKTPLAVSGRVLVYTNPEEEFHAGDCVCAGPDGLAYRMTREEIIEFPDRIVGVVSEIPTYETWGTGNVEVNGRIWIKVK